MDGGEELCAVPAALRSNLQQQHPEAEGVYWEPWNQGFKVSFFENGASKEQFFAASGQVICACTYLEASELPSQIRQFISSRYPNLDTPSVVLKMERPSHSTLYRVHLDLPEGLLELVFNESGQLKGENLESYSN